MPVAPSLEEPSTSAPPAPKHVAIIMDGNGRWAKARGLPRFAGHQKGAKAVRAVVEGCQELGIRHLTLYAFSSENWKRPQAEVNDLMGLLRLYLKRELADLHRNNVRMQFIGDFDALQPDIQNLIESAQRKTSGNTALCLTIALNYGSHDEIVEACRKLARAVENGELRADAISEDLFRAQLQTADIPDPDLLIRTSGEQRLSNFLLWQAAYSELVFLDTLWPDFTKDHLAAAVHEYQRRERRYGAASA